MIKLTLNCDDNDITLNKKNYLLRAADRLGIKVFDYNNEKECPEECVLNIEPFFKFVQGSKWTGVWEIDLLMDRQEMNASNWSYSDKVFLASTNLPGRLEGQFTDRIMFFPQACDPVLHCRNKKIKPDYDLVFSGSVGLDVYVERERVLKIMRDNFSFKDFGKGHLPINYVNKLCEARVQFVRSGQNQIGPGQVAQRFFECLAIGPVLKDYHSDLDHLGLIEGEDYFSYKNDEEMIAKMKILLKNPEQAQLMAKKGREKALMYHTYENRLMALFNIIQEKIE